MVESTASGSRPNVQTTDVEFAGVHGVRASEQDTESPTCRIVQLGEKSRQNLRKSGYDPACRSATIK